MKKKLLIILGIMILCIILVYIKICQNTLQNTLQNRIMKYIDEKSNNDMSCTVIMNEVTSFEWDRMLIYQVGSSRHEISEILGVELIDSVDLMSGIIFVKDKKIVYKESEMYNPDKPNELTYYFGRFYGEGEEEYGIFTPESAIFEGEKIKFGNNFFYQLKLINESDSERTPIT